MVVVSTSSLNVPTVAPAPPADLHVQPCLSSRLSHTANWAMNGSKHPSYLDVRATCGREARPFQDHSAALMTGGATVISSTTHTACTAMSVDEPSTPLSSRRPLSTFAHRSIDELRTVSKSLTATVEVCKCATSNSSVTAMR